MAASRFRGREISPSSKMILTIFILLLFGGSIFSRPYEESYLEKSPILCRREHRDNFHSFVADRWDAARKSMGLPNMNVSIYSNHYVYINFVKFHSGIVIFTTPDNATDLPYVRIYKCANEAIVQNLFFGKKFRDVPPNWITIKNYEEFIKYKDTYVVQRPNRVLKKSFTFVRDPLVRFESGFAEAIWYTNDFNQRRNLGPQINVTSAEDVKSLLTQFLELNSPFSRRGGDHLSTMSKVFFEFDIDVVGYLESFFTDWQAKIVAGYNLDLYNHTFNHKLGKHSSAINHPGMEQNIQLRINSARLYFQKLLEADSSVMNAICHLVMIDYVCLAKYSLPAKCQHLYPILDAGRKLLQLGTPKPN